MTLDFQKELLVLGIGNPIRGNDAAGLRVVDTVKSHLLTSALSSRVGFAKAVTTGPDLLEVLEGYDSFLVVDACFAVQFPDGTVRWIRAERLQRLSSFEPMAHQMHLPETLALGKALGLPLPRWLGAVVIGVGDACLTFQEGLSEHIEQAVKRASDMVISRIQTVLAKNVTSW